MIARIYRGLPGAGKTTRATCEVPVVALVAADDFRDWSKPFDATRNTLAHEGCFARWLRLVRSAHPVIGVHNTFVTEETLFRYIESARVANRVVEIVDLFDGGLTDEQLASRNVHQVPIEVICNMRKNYFPSR